MGISQDTSGYRLYVPYSAVVTEGSGKCSISATPGGSGTNPSAVTITIGSQTATAAYQSTVTLADVPITTGDKIIVTVNGSSNYFTTLGNCTITYS